MKSFEWSETFLIGMPDLDDDHRALVEMVGEIAILAAADSPLEVLAVAMDRMLERFHDHIATEESYLAVLTSPAGRDHRARHLAEHTKFLEHIAVMRRQLAHGQPVGEAVEGFGALLTLTELIRTDYDMVGMLRREGRLSPDGELVSPGA